MEKTHGVALVPPTSIIWKDELCGYVIDLRDKRKYKVIKAGNQIWLAQNLAFFNRKGGCWAYGDNTENVNIYGYLYDWETAKNVCLPGWRIPDNKDWDELIEYLGGEKHASGKLKESGTEHWKKPNSVANNSVLWSALPGGYFTGLFHHLGEYASFWSSSRAGKYKAWYINLAYDSGFVFRDFDYRNFGFSVRCVKN